MCTRIPIKSARIEVNQMYIPGFVPKTIAVETQDPFVLVVTYDTGEVKTLNIANYIEKHEEMAPLKSNDNLFKNPEVSLCGYMTVWNDGKNLISFHNDYVYWYGERIKVITLKE